MKLLAIFSISAQNQQVLVDCRCPSKVVGCMNLTSMADNKELQCYGWEVLTNVLSVPTPLDKKVFHYHTTMSNTVIRYRNRHYLFIIYLYKNSFLALVNTWQINLSSIINAIF